MKRIIYILPFFLLALALFLPTVLTKDDIASTDDISKKQNQILEKIKNVNIKIDVHGTEYNPNENATIWLQLLRDYQAITNASCYVTAYYPDKSVWLNNENMNYLDNGIYYYDTTTPAITGVYIISATCEIPANSFTDYFNDYSYLEDYKNVTISNGKIILDSYQTIVAGNVTLTPIAWWHLNENSGTTAYDSSGNGYNGLLSAGGWTTGILNNCWTNAGVDTGITVSGFGDYDLNNSFSAEAWIKTNISGSQTILGRMEDTGSGKGWSFAVAYNGNGHKVKVQLRNNTGSSLQASSLNSVNDNSWHHVIMTYNGSNNANGILIYVDGIENTNATSRGGSNIYGSIKNSAKFSIGSRNLMQIFFYGKIDEVAIHTKVINQTEITFRYNNSYGTELMNDSFYTNHNYTFGYIQSKPILLTGTNWLNYSASYNLNGESLGFRVLDNNNNTLCEGLGNIYSCAGSTSTIKLYANLSRSTESSLSPEINSWNVVWYSATQEEIKGSGEMHISSLYYYLQNLINDIALRVLQLFIGVGHVQI